MKTARKLSFLLLIIVLIQACKTHIPVIEADEFVSLDTIEINSNSKRELYRASETRKNDLLHTKLEVSFDWDSTFLYGKAQLQLVPYFYSTDSLVLDAKGFQIHEVSMVDQIGKRSPLAYSYDQAFLRIFLGKTYTRKDTYQIFIDYTAMPNKLKAGGSAAITQKKGLYFINPDGSDPNKPRQIWTQGETESSSCWFPTIDSPNERTSQEIYMTVDSQYVTLSNGELMFQSENPDGSRTDYWKQELPHAPYLFMMAVGEFAIVEEEWRGKPVHYYVEPQYEAVAKETYPNTIEMLEFFSNRLNYDYPWDKYHQIVVRDYVSGAMENTGAVIFGDFIQGDHRFLIDNAGEDIVAHELFHHWFGDLVTCESWSNLPLNESFATYGEYLWNEHKYGKDEAELHGRKDLKRYLGQSIINKKKLIRFNYESEMEMFDSHSYQKGGRVLHLLRNYVGDDAFFAALNLYLKTNEFKAVEIHQLRLAFEEVTGKDLNWFFDQWFFSKGHPIIDVDKQFNNDTLTITIEQKQNGGGVPEVFRIPTTIEVVQSNGYVLTQNIELNKRKQTLQMPLSSTPLLVNLDLEKVIVGEVNQAIRKSEAVSLYQNSHHFIDKYDAIKLLMGKSDSASLAVMTTALKDDFWYIRKTAIESVSQLADNQPVPCLKILKALAENDPKSDVRAAAIRAISKHFESQVALNFFDQGINDSSYLVVSASLDAIYAKDEPAGITKAEQLEKESNSSILLSIASIYAAEGAPERMNFYESKLANLSGFKKYPMLGSYGEFLLKQNNETSLKAIPNLKAHAMGEDLWVIRLAAVNSLIKLKNTKEDQLRNLNNELGKLEESSPEREKITDQLASTDQVKQQIKSALKEIGEQETNDRIKRLINQELK